MKINTQHLPEIIALLCFAIAMVSSIWFIAGYIGRRNTKQFEKRQQENYLYFLNMLKLGIYDGFLDKNNFNSIEMMFEEISRYECKDENEILKLKKDFYERFSRFTNEDVKRDNNPS